MKNEEKGKFLVFCYGSLKKGFENSDFLADQTYLGEADTANEGFIMVSLGGFPAVCKYDVEWHVKGEIYEVDQRGLTYLDELESNGSLYTRSQEQFVLNGETVTAWIYLMPAQLAMRVMSQNKRYSGSHIVQKAGNSLVWT